MIGLVGSHRTGKTTLALEYAKVVGCEFVQTDVSGVFARNGADPKVDYDFSRRLSLQFKIIEHLAEVYQGASHSAITDRTPLDLLAYTVADIRRENMTPQNIMDFMKYEEACFRLTNAKIHSILLVQPGIPLVEREGSAPANIAYMNHLNLIMKGLLLDARLNVNTLQIRTDVLDLKARVTAVKKLTERGMEKAENERNIAGFQGRLN